MASRPTTPDADAKKAATERIEKTSSHDADDFVARAKEATDFEQNMTVRQALKYYPWAVLWSVAVSTSIIMEGYDIVLIGNMIAQPSFQQYYGSYFGEELGYQITGPWQMGMGIATAIGTIAGAFANGW